MKTFILGRGALERRDFVILCILVCLLGLALRIPGFASKPLWLDEAYSAWFASRSFTELWTIVPQYEVHPPLYYSLLRLWTLILGDSEAALRGLSLLASVATILVLSISGRVLRAGDTGDRFALLAALLLAINTGNIYYAQEARPYALETLTASIAILASLRIFQTIRGGEASSWPPMLALGIAGGVTLGMHNTAPFIVFGIWAALVAATLIYAPGQRMKGLAVIVVAGAIALVIWSPLAPIFFSQSRNMAGLSFWVRAQREDLWSAWYLILGGEATFYFSIFAGLLGLAALIRIDRAIALQVATVLFLPLALLLAIHFGIKPVFIKRLFEWEAPLAMATISAGLVMSGLSRYIRVVLGSIIVAFMLLTTVQVYPVPKENWPGFVDIIAQDARPGDIVMAAPNEINPALWYYSRNRQAFPPIVYIPGPYPYRDPTRRYVSNFGAPLITQADRVNIRAALEGHRRIWLIRRAMIVYDPDDIVVHEVSADRKRVRTFRDDNILFALFE